MVDRSARWKISWQQSPLAACPQEVKDGVEDGTKVGGTRSAASARTDSGGVRTPPERRKRQTPKSVDRTRFSAVWRGSS